jgi:homoserine kinase
LLGKPLDESALLKLATETEGHPDNVAPALLGGLVVSAMIADEIITRRFEVPALTVVVVKPEVHWPTKVARSVLPKSVSRQDAIFNIGRTTLVLDALRNGDLALLQKVMDDRLHQPYRMSHIPGCENAWKAARKFGAAALSGAGPSIIAFVPPEAKEETQAAMLAAFRQAKVDARGLFSHPSSVGVHVF